MSSFAARSGNLAIVNAFLEKGVDQHKENRWGETALHVAVRSGNLAVVNAFLEKGVDQHKENRWGRQPFMWRVRKDMRMWSKFF